jgi:hypothetical protein
MRYELKLLYYLEETQLPLYHKISKIDMICFAKPGRAEDLYIGHKEECTLDKCEAYS